MLNKSTILPFLFSSGTLLAASTKKSETNRRFSSSDTTLASEVLFNPAFTTTYVTMTTNKSAIFSKRP